MFYSVIIGVPQAKFIFIPFRAGFIEIQLIMSEKKPFDFKSPDVSKLKEVVIDHKTKIYISPDADEEEAKNRYKFRTPTRREK